VRIAYTLNGLVGSFTSGKHYDEDTLNSYGGQSLLTLRYISKYLKKYILDKNDVDIFIFSWETDKEKEFNEYLNPKKMKLIPQIDFEIPEHLRGKNDKRVMAHYSRWYGFKEVMKLKREYEQENNFKYDLVVNARFDLCFNRPFDFSSLPINEFHIPIHPNRPTYGWPSENPEILDHIFASSSENMDIYSNLFDKLGEYTLPDQCPQWNTISNHFLMVWHLWKLDLLYLDVVKKSFSTYTGDIVDNQDGKTDYDIIRYRNLSLDDITKELENE
tara:strand:+ start:6601 stop:7419 length:819 start_codon:yes stop_codon:yes gene_type:complete